LEGALGLGGFAVAFGNGREARAFGEEGAFNPRTALDGSCHLRGRSRVRAGALGSRARQSHGARRLASGPAPVRADDDALFSEPFAYFVGDGPVSPLTDSEIAHLRRFFAEGGVLLVDDSAPENGVFGRDANESWRASFPMRHLFRLVPSMSFPLVLFHSPALWARRRPPRLDAIVRGGNAQVLFSAHDIGGAFGPVGHRILVGAGDARRRASA